MALCFCAGAGLSTTQRALAQPGLEYEVKAAFLLNFTKFIEWPATAFADAESPFAICILGKDPFGRALDDIVAGEVVGARKLVVRRLSASPEPRACQVLFADGAQRDTRRLLASLGPGVLTVGEGEGFLRDNGMIAFVLDNRRVRFDINQSAAERAALKLSSRLLNVARAVEK
jgi:hypothetical protein